MSGDRYGMRSSEINKARDRGSNNYRSSIPGKSFFIRSIRATGSFSMA